MFSKLSILSNFSVFLSSNFTKIWVSHNLFFVFTMGLKLQVAFAGRYSQSTLLHHFQYSAITRHMKVTGKLLYSVSLKSSRFVYLFIYFAGSHKEHLNLNPGLKNHMTYSGAPTEMYSCLCICKCCIYSMI